MTLSQSIKRAMKQQRLGPNQFHRHAGIARSTLFALLANKNTPSVRTLRALRRAGVSIPRDLLAS